jgi:hypothetical protein
MNSADESWMGVAATIRDLIIPGEEECFDRQTRRRKSGEVVLANRGRLLGRFFGNQAF